MMLNRRNSLINISLKLNPHWHYYYSYVCTYGTSLAYIKTNTTHPPTHSPFYKYITHQNS